jgi:hypothetical protein
MRRMVAILSLSVLVATASIGALAASAGAAGSAGGSAPGPSTNAHSGPAGHSTPGSAPAPGALVGPATRSPRVIVPATWSLDSVPSPSTTADASLEGTSCVSSAFCMAVGYVYDPGADTETPLAQEWNGTSWTSVPVPSVGANETYLYGVSCISSSWCMAVGGAYLNETTDRDVSVTEQWNGSAWSMVTTPQTVTTGDQELVGVSCSSTTFCAAVGTTSDADDNYDLALTMTWNGSAWSLGTVTPASFNSDLQSVSCTGPTFCSAVGFTYVTDGGAELTLAEIWNGSTWTVVPASNSLPSGDNSLYGVSCTSATFCVAVGYAGDLGYTPTDENTYRTLIEEWNGSAWSVMASPNVSTGGVTYGNFLYGVSCVGPTSCVAVGSPYTDADAETYSTLAMAWNGSTWAVQPTPNPTASPVYAYLEAVSCVAGQLCKAVGIYETDTEPDNYDQPFAISAPLPRSGYQLVASDGGVFSFNSLFSGSAGNLTLNKPVVGMATTPDGGGYWLVASDGGIFAYGDAVFYGSAGSLSLNKPIVGMASTPDGGGYWLVASDGGIFAYGDAVFYGSAGSLSLNKPIVGMAATPGGGGYWLVASDGGIFSYGDAVFQGSAGSLVLNKPVVGMASTGDGQGYWLVASDGGIFTYGDALFHGSAGSLALNKPVVGMASTGDGQGYWLVASDGGIFSYGDALFQGSTGGSPLNKPIVGMSG